jgi:hypothetical protein
MGIMFVLLLASWGGCLIYGINKLPHDPETISELGSFGDFFGCFNALVSVLGFSAVFYSLHKQHEDAKNANEQFVVNSRIELFEKRFDIYQKFLFVINRVKGNGGISLEESDDVHLAWLKARFLFPEDEPLHQLFEKLHSFCYKISVLDDICANKSGPPNSGHTFSDFDKLDLIQVRKDRAELDTWFRKQKEPLEKLIFKYLKIGSGV